ncbi:MAG: radical SAM protein [Rhodospirillaceae bacterium]
MGDLALPYIMPRITDPVRELRKYANFLSALRRRRLRSERVHHTPVDATVDLTTTCQLHCPYCVVGNGTMRRQVSLMRPDLYHDILGIIGPNAFIIWYFSTGEPLLHKHFAELLAYSKHHEVFSVISTNLSLPLSDERIDGLLSCGLGMISVSLDGASAESYSRYRKGGCFDLVIENLSRLIQRRAVLGLEHPLIEWRCLRFRHNQDEEPEVRRLALELNTDLLEFYPGSAPASAPEGTVQTATKPVGGSPIDGPALVRGLKRRDSDLHRLLADRPPQFGMPALRPAESRCDWLYLGTMVYPDASVGPCCVSNDRADDFTELSFPTTSFETAWNSEPFLRSRDMFVTGKPAGTICDRCPLPAAQTYQFIQKIRAIVRNAPPWVLKVLSVAPGDFFVDLDDALMPQEAGMLRSGAALRALPALADPQPEIAADLAGYCPDSPDIRHLIQLVR